MTPINRDARFLPAVDKRECQKALAFRAPHNTEKRGRRFPEAQLPRYDYRCTSDACENGTFEVSKSYNDTSATLCPVCSVEAKKLLSPIAVHFKGSGFYVTDNRGSNGASGSSSDSSDSSESENKTDSKKSDSKSESKSESSSKSDSSPSSPADPKNKSTTASSSSD